MQMDRLTASASTRERAGAAGSAGVLDEGREIVCTGLVIVPIGIILPEHHAPVRRSITLPGVPVCVCDRRAIHWAIDPVP